MSQIRTNAILDANGGTTATVNGIPLRPGVLDPENRIINGSFDFWQRGTSSTAGGYLADRWQGGVVGGTVTTSRQSFTLGDTLGSNSPTYFLRQTVSGQSLASHYGLIGQPIESVRSYAGQTITVLGWARRSSGTGNMTLELAQVYGTGGSPSSITFATPQTITLTGSWAAFAATFTVPSITGKTLGSNNNDNLTLNFWTSAGSDFNSRTNALGLQTIGVDLWGIHIKLGTHTTAAVDLYKQPELGPELARCQRYYQTTGMGATGRTASATLIELADNFITPMRTNPAISFGGFAGASVQIGQFGVANVTATGVSASTTTANGWYAAVTVSGATTGAIAAAANGNILAADAEI